MAFPLPTVYRLRQLVNDKVDDVLGDVHCTRVCVVGSPTGDKKRGANTEGVPDKRGYIFPFR